MEPEKVTVRWTSIDRKRGHRHQRTTGQVTKMTEETEKERLRGAECQARYHTGQMEIKKKQDGQEVGERHWKTWGRGCQNIPYWKREFRVGGVGRK